MNLVVKSLLKPFDISKKQQGEVFDDAEEELYDLAEGIELEEAELVVQQAAGGTDKEEGDSGDNNEGWIDEVAAMTEFDQEQLWLDVQPVQLELVKVSQYKA